MSARPADTAHAEREGAGTGGPVANEQRKRAKRRSRGERSDLYQDVTDQIIAELEQGRVRTIGRSFAPPRWRPKRRISS